MDGLRPGFAGRVTLFGLTLAVGSTVFIGEAAASLRVPPTAPGDTVRVSVAQDGAQANGPTWGVAISANGWYVAFGSWATNLVPGSGASTGNVYVRDLKARRTELVSVASDGTAGNGFSWYPSISADGRYVAFMSMASNLVPGDTNEADDIFVRDRLAGRTERVSVADDGSQLPSHSSRASISANGQRIAFVNGSSSGQGTIMVRNRDTGHTTLISVAFDGGTANFVSENPAISANGRYVAFQSGASNLVPDDTNSLTDIFVHDLVTRQTSRASVGASGQSNAHAFLPAISGDGRDVTFVSQASNLTPEPAEFVLNLFVRDRVGNQTRLVSATALGVPADSDSFTSAMDFSGRHIVYYTLAANLVPGDVNGRQDVLLYDQATGLTRLVPVGLGGEYPNAGSFSPAIDASGCRIAYDSDASNLVPADTNQSGDAFLTTVCP